MSHINPVSVLANVATGGLYGIAKGIDKAITTGKVGAGAADALATTGPAGNVLQPAVGTKNALAVEGAAAAGAAGAGLAGAGAATAEESAMAPAAVEGVEATGSAAGTQGAGGSLTAGSSGAAATAPAAAGTGSSLMSTIGTGASVASAGTMVAGAMKKPGMPQLPQAPAPPTMDSTKPQQAAAEAKVNEDDAKRTKTLLTSGEGATDYGQHSFAPSLIGNNTYLKSVIGS